MVVPRRSSWPSCTLRIRSSSCSSTTFLALPLLVYKNPFSKDLKRENTIGMWEAVQFLANEGKPSDKAFVADLKWIKDLRNDIEHSQFDMDVPTVRKTMGRLVQAITEFHSDVSEEDELEAFVSKENMPLYQELADEYAREMGQARTAAKEANEDGRVYDCCACGSLLAERC